MTDYKKTFAQAYQVLNPLQKAAVDHIEQGPLLLLAGPGTGKTQVLAMRIANILRQTDARPENILALTFTDAAAKNMRERLLSLIGKEAYYLNIETFHSFCRQVITDYPEYFPLHHDGNNLSDLEKFQLFEQLIDQHRPENLRPLNDPYSYLSSIIGAISDLKREGVSVADFERILEAEADKLAQLRVSTKSQSKIRQAEKNLAKQKDLLLLYQEYQKQLRATQRYDYDDMINFVVTAFSEHEDLLRTYQENLHYFLVDEYQDSNSAQNKLLNLLASYWEETGGQADLFAVGDPNQAIFRFQGASVENVLAFTRQYPQATVITLDQAYRSPQLLYDAATELIAFNQLSKIDPKTAKIKLVLRLKSSNQAKRQIQLFKAQSQVLESIYVAEKIKTLLAEGVPAAEIAVLYRNNADALAIQEALSKWQLPYQLLRGENILESNEIAQLLDLMRLINALDQGEDPDLLYAVMNFQWLALDALSLMKLSRLAYQQQRDLLTLLQQPLAEINQGLGQQSINESAWQKIQNFYQKIQIFAQKNHNLTFNHWFEELISQEGFAFLPYLQARNNGYLLISNLNALYTEIKNLLQANKGMKLADFLQVIDTYVEHKLGIKALPLQARKEAIYLSTVHSAKGMEWQHVFLIGFNDRRWGNQRERAKLKLPNGILSNTDLSAKEKNEDERRLFYVAMTRAKQQLYITYPEKIIENNYEQDKFPSVFLTELAEVAEKLKQPVVVEEAASGLLEVVDEHLAKLLSVAPAPVSSDQQQKEFLRSVVKNFSLSVTALNTYLRDPEEFLRNNLLRVPRAKAVYMSFGTAVHAALESYFRTYQQNQAAATLDLLLAVFEQALQREILRPEDYQDRLKFGRKILSHYYQEMLSQTQPQVVAVEKVFGGRQKIYLGDIPLTGKIDRLDWLDRDQKIVKVIDYKTGRPQTVGQIEASSPGYRKDFSQRELALPVSIRGPYQRQLVFYKLLLELDRNGPKLQVGGAEFAFIQPNDSDKIVSRSFQISDEAVSELKQLIKQVMMEIRELRFLPATTEDSS